MRVCLIGATHPFHNPRLLREADSLADAGHDVRVVTPAASIGLDQRDERQLAKRKWKHQKVNYLPSDWRGKARSIFLRGRRRAAFAAYQMFGGERLAEYGYIIALPEQRRQASFEQADWFIAHAQAALPAAAGAARRWNARLGFDCEDLLAEHGTDPADIVRRIETTYLPLCDYVSAPSRGIARRLQNDYDIPAPLVLYNVFPLHLSTGMLPPVERPMAPALRLHWFSQTIGPGRGIEEAIEACGMLGGGVELHLRGKASEGYEGVLRALASQHDANLKFHPQLDHDDLIKSMQHFDVGLALERGGQTNYALTVTNKIGSYLLAGLAIAATDTPGQREILEGIPAAGFLYSSGNPRGLAEGLLIWLGDRDRLRNSQQAAWDAARRRYCWDIEQQDWLGLLQTRDRSNTLPAQTQN